MHTPPRVLSPRAPLLLLLLPLAASLICSTATVIFASNTAPPPAAFVAFSASLSPSPPPFLTLRTRGGLRRGFLSFAPRSSSSLSSSSLGRAAGAATDSESSHSPSHSSPPLSWKDLPPAELDAILSVAKRACRAAGSILVDNLGSCSVNDGECDTETGRPLSSSPTAAAATAEVKTNIKDVVTQYDGDAQRMIEGTIRASYPDHSFLGEENVDPGAAASEAALRDALSSSPTGYVWIVDPIDGTANFAAGLPLCAVTVGVVYRGEVVMGCTHDPHRNETFAALRGRGAYLTVGDDGGDGTSLEDGERLRCATAVTSASDAIVNAGCPADPSAFEASMRGVLALNSKTRGIRIVACSALTTAWIASGRLAAHFGYDLSSWDLVAGALLIQEAGGRVTGLDGSEYGIETRDMLCSNGLIHDEILEALEAADATSFVRSM